MYFFLYMLHNIKCNHKWGKKFSQFHPNYVPLYFIFFTWQIILSKETYEARMQAIDGWWLFLDNAEAGQEKLCCKKKKLYMSIGEI